MADGAAGVAVIGSVIALRVEERWLQNPRREINVVHLRIVVSVDRGRRHPPLAAINWLANFGKLTSILEMRPTIAVPGIVASLNLQLGVVAPFVGIANLVRHAMQLFQRFLLGGAAHPRQLLQITLHGFLNSLHHLGGALFRIRAKVLLGVDLTERFSQIAVHSAHALLPTRRHLLASLQGLAIKAKILFQEW